MSTKYLKLIVVSFFALSLGGLNVFPVGASSTAFAQIPELAPATVDVENQNYQLSSPETLLSLGSQVPLRGFIRGTLKASYYDGTDLQDFVLSSRYRTPIDFYRACWDEDYPYIGCKLIDELADGADYSVKWQGKLFVPEDGKYTFTLGEVDDGARLILDGIEIVDNGWYAPNPDLQPSPQSVSLLGGIHDIRIDYEQTAPFVVELHVRWSGPGFAEEVIPLATGRQVQ